MSEQTADLCTTDACESLRARLAKYEDAEGRPLQPAADLARRIDKAIKDFTSGRASMHVPPQDTDVDIVLAECLKLVKGLNSSPASAGVKLPDDFVCDSKPLQDLLNATAMLLDTPCPDSATYWAAMLANVEALLKPVSAGDDAEEAFEQYARPLGFDLTVPRIGDYIAAQTVLAWEGFKAGAAWQARTALSANHSEQVRVVCRHEFSDNGEFTVHCSKCDLAINAEPPRHVLSSAAQQAFEVGGTEDGGYALTGDELDQIVAQACAMAVIEFAAAPSAGSQGGDV